MLSQRYSNNGTEWKQRTQQATSCNKAPPEDRQIEFRISQLQEEVQHPNT